MVLKQTFRGYNLKNKNVATESSRINFFKKNGSWTENPEAVKSAQFYS